jgi:tRNA pseudouridine13 synthase
MKIKVQPEDFVVEELVSLPFAKKGLYTILELRKRYWNTLDVIDYIARILNQPRRLFARSGLKDRYSLSTQYLSFKGTIKHEIREKNFTVTPVGRTNCPISPLHMLGNRFTITVRHLSISDIDMMIRNYKSVRDNGLPNFFDEQRFGSARHGKGFIAKEIMHKHYRGAARLLLCYSYKEDSTQEKKFKRCCAEHWDEIHTCAGYTPRAYRKIVNALCAHPSQYKNALKTIDRELLNLYLLAYQSYLFNETANAFIERSGIDIRPIHYVAGQLLFYKALANKDELDALCIPMVHSKLPMRGPAASIINSLLKREGVSLKNFSLNHMRLRGVRFKPLKRSLILHPQDFFIGSPEPDELYHNQLKLVLSFILPPGSYATLVIKRLACKG